MLDREDILGRIPQAEPFVFLDAAEIESESIVGSYRITGTEDCLKGHFPGRPIFPASILVEALGQLGVLYITECYRSGQVDPESIYFIKSEVVSCHRRCLPGDLLDMQLRVVRAREPLIQFSGRISVSGEVALKIELLTLSFSTQPAG